MCTIKSLSNIEPVTLKNETIFPTNPIHTQLVSIHDQLYIYLDVIGKKGWFLLTDLQNNEYIRKNNYKLVIDFDIDDISLKLFEEDKYIPEYSVTIIDNRVYITFDNIYETHCSMTNVNIYDYVDKQLSVLLSPFKGRYNRKIICDESNHQVIEANQSNISVYDSDQIFFGKMDIDVLGTLIAHADINVLKNDEKFHIFHSGNDGCKSGLNASHLNGILSNNIVDPNHEHKEYLRLSHNTYSNSHLNIRDMINKNKKFLEKPTIIGFERNKMCETVSIQDVQSAGSSSGSGSPS